MNAPLIQITQYPPTMSKISPTATFRQMGVSSQKGYHSDIFFGKSDLAKDESQKTKRGIRFWGPVGLFFAALGAFATIRSSGSDDKATDTRDGDRSKADDSRQERPEESDRQ